MPRDDCGMRSKIRTRIDKFAIVRRKDLSTGGTLEFLSPCSNDNNVEDNKQNDCMLAEMERQNGPWWNESGGTW